MHHFSFYVLICTGVHASWASTPHHGTPPSGARWKSAYLPRENLQEPMLQHPAWVAARAIACGLWDSPHLQGSALGLSGMNVRWIFIFLVLKSSFS